MVYAVIDTNIFVSAFITKNATASTRRVINSLFAGKIRWRYWTMENKMTASANYAMRHPPCLQSHQTAIPTMRSQSSKYLFVSMRSHKKFFSKAGSSPHKKTQLRCWRRPLMVRQPYSEAGWAPSRAVSSFPLRGKVVQMSAMKARFQIAECSQPSPWEKGLGGNGGPSLKGKGGLVGFRKNTFFQKSSPKDNL